MRAARRLWAVGIFDLAGWREGGGDERLEPGDDRRARAAARRRTRSSCSTCARRTSATRASSRAAAISRTAPRGRRRRTASAASRPIVTICESGPRAAIAASVLHAAGLDARPVLDGGIDDVARARRRDDELPPLRQLGGRSRPVPRLEMPANEGAADAQRIRDYTVHAAPRRRGPGKPAGTPRPGRCSPSRPPGRSGHRLARSHLGTQTLRAAIVRR